MKCTRTVAVILSAVALMSCSSVVLRTPVGSPTADDLSDDLDGVWQGPEGEIMYVKYLSDGKMKVAGVNSDSDEFELYQTDGLVTEVEGFYVVNVKDVESDDPEGTYAFARLELPDDDVIIVYLPDVDLFDEAVENGVLAGSTRSGYGTTVTIDETAEKLEAFFHLHADRDMFDLADVLVFRRIQD